MLLEELVCELVGYYIHCLVLYFSTHSLAKHIYFITETAISYYEMVDRALRCYDIQLETVILFNEFKNSLPYFTGNVSAIFSTIFINSLVDHARWVNCLFISFPGINIFGALSGDGGQNSVVQRISG